MTPLDAICDHDPVNNSWGDCHRTCFAMLFDMRPEEVPHFFDKRLCPTIKHSKDLRHRWLLGKGYVPIDLTFVGEPQDLRQTMGIIAPDVYWILGANTSEGVGHSVVCQGSMVAKDPSGDNLSAERLISQNGETVATLLVPVRFTRYGEALKPLSTKREIGSDP